MGGRSKELLSCARGDGSDRVSGRACTRQITPRALLRINNWNCGTRNQQVSDGGNRRYLSLQSKHCPPYKRRFQAAKRPRNKMPVPA